MAKEKSVIGLQGFRYAIIKEDDDGEEKYGDIEKVKGLVDVTVETDEDLETQYADDGVYDIANAVGDTTAEFNFAAIALEQRAELSGVKVEDGMVKFGKDTDSPFLAVAFKGQKSNGKFRHVGLVKGKGSSYTNEEWKTKEDGIDFGNEPWNATFMNRDSDGLLKIVADEDAKDFDMDKFDEAVFGKKASGGSGTSSTSGKK